MNPHEVTFLSLNVNYLVNSYFSIHKHPVNYHTSVWERTNFALTVIVLLGKLNFPSGVLDAHSNGITACKGIRDHNRSCPYKELR